MLYPKHQNWVQSGIRVDFALVFLILFLISDLLLLIGIRVMSKGQQGFPIQSQSHNNAQDTCTVLFLLKAVYLICDAFTSQCCVQLPVLHMYRKVANFLEPKNLSCMLLMQEARFFLKLLQFIFSFPSLMASLIIFSLNKFICV